MPISVTSATAQWSADRFNNMEEARQALVRWRSVFYRTENPIRNST